MNRHIIGLCPQTQKLESYLTKLYNSGSERVKGALSSGVDRFSLIDPCQKLAKKYCLRPSNSYGLTVILTVWAVNLASKSDIETENLKIAHYTELVLSLSLLMNSFFRLLITIN